MRAVRFAVLLLGLVGGSLPAFAAENFPTRPIKFVVGFLAGGPNDTIARIFCDWLQPHLGAPCVVENKVGQGGMIAAKAVIDSPPDGYTFMFVAPNNAIGQSLYKNLPFNHVRDTTPIASIMQLANIMVVPPSLPVKTVAEFIAYGKANPGKLSYGSFGIGTSAHIFGDVFAKNTGLELTHVPYRGSADLSADLQENRIQMAFDAAPSAINNAKSGKVKIFAVAAPSRWPFLPDAPTFAEQGVKDIDIVSFLGWYGPAGMNPEVVRRLNAALVTSIAQQSVKDNYALGAYTAESSTPQDLAMYTRQAYDAWGALVKRAGIAKQ